jgi:C-terminal processing protease CtpA/Prc
MYQVSLAPAVEPHPTYYIGVSVSAPDDALRAHLQIPAGQGLLATEIIADSPAARAGVRVHDVLLSLNGKTIDSTENFIKAVQETEGKASTLVVLRAGEQTSIAVTPQVRKDDAQRYHEAVRLWTIGQQAHPNLYQNTNQNMSNWYRTPYRVDLETKRLADIESELKSLRKSVEELKDALKARSK